MSRRVATSLFWKNGILVIWSSSILTVQCNWTQEM
ncbi:hypothetical protein Goari_017922 [Gossypium aridum]|uniref:Uncharacterized protein n=1 Tax=Gossypium aridum TaxID=34290 RepID=A0A7J8WN61_GOSAI|nr:hypothetical protein [Gossypium aridum]